jgi:hypothetical protein
MKNQENNDFLIILKGNYIMKRQDINEAKGNKLTTYRLLSEAQEKNI